MELKTMTSENPGQLGFIPGYIVLTGIVQKG